MPSQICIYGEFCGKGLAFECDGSVFSCDHYVYPEYRLGNIVDKTISEMVFSGHQKDFGFAKRDTLPQYCWQCQHLKMCWGECSKNRLLRTPEGQLGLNYFCSGLKCFFEHAEPYLKDLANRYR